MKTKQAAELANRYRVRRGKNFRLKDVDPADTWNFDSKESACDMLDAGVLRLKTLQEKLYAHDQWAVLLIFQAMDAAGKDGTIKHVMSGVNPQGCQVFSFKAPSAQELDHDFLWRGATCLPERGRIGIFNRSYYEETLVVRVHPEFLKGQKIPEQLITKRIWKERFEDINAFEQHLARNGVAVRKFFLHVSREEQRRRFLSRLEEKEKHWKFSAADLKERARWDDYMDAYEETIRHTASKDSPWYVVPADHKWFTRLVVAAAVIETLESLEPGFPKLSASETEELEKVRDGLLNEGEQKP
ncbi:MAG TPA: polyphosphate kinase 2 family protein [Chthoniobacteraceae bacterium]|jgi:PPK2 family polyphosphate:nucleotide phosphotransferase